VIREIEGFRGFSMQFLFKNPDKDGKDSNTLIFAKKECVFEFNYMTAVLTTTMTLQKSLSR